MLQREIAARERTVFLSRCQQTRWHLRVRIGVLILPLKSSGDSAIFKDATAVPVKPGIILNV